MSYDTQSSLDAPSHHVEFTLDQHHSSSAELHTGVEDGITSYGKLDSPIEGEAQSEANESPTLPSFQRSRPKKRARSPRDDAQEDSSEFATCEGREGVSKLIIPPLALPSSKSQPPASQRDTSEIPYTVPTLNPPIRHLDLVYERIRCIGEGSYGSVYLARVRDTPSPRHVAIKVLKRLKAQQGFEGFPITSVREIRILRYLATARKSAPKLASRVIRLDEVLVSSDYSETGLVFEFMEYDLYKVLAFPTQLPEAVIALYSAQLLEGLSFIHQRCIMHRDLKSSNVLLNAAGELKLADFGMAREWRRDAQQVPMTPRVATLWYRAPELLLQRPNYDASVDVWSCGCIFAEMFLCRPLFRVVQESNHTRGRAEIAQLHCIFDILGTPPEVEWPDFSKHVQSIGMMVPDSTPSKLREYMLQHALVKPNEAALDLLSKMLSLSPKTRPTAIELLKHAYFYNPEWVDRECIRKQLRHKLERHSYCSSGFTLALSSRNSSTHAGSSLDGRPNPPTVTVAASSHHHRHVSSSNGTQSNNTQSRPQNSFTRKTTGASVQSARVQGVPSTVVQTYHTNMKCTLSPPPVGPGDRFSSNSLSNATGNTTLICSSPASHSGTVKRTIGGPHTNHHLPLGEKIEGHDQIGVGNATPASSSSGKLRLTIGRMRAHDRIMTRQEVLERNEQVARADWLDQEVAKVVKEKEIVSHDTSARVPQTLRVRSKSVSLRVDSLTDQVNNTQRAPFRLRMIPRPLTGPETERQKVTHEISSRNDRVSQPMEER